MLKCVLNRSTNDFCQYCPRREVLRCGTVLRSICQASWPSPTTTLDRKRTSQGKGIVFGELSIFSARLCWSICWTLSQLFFVRTVLGDKASEVEQVPNILKVAHQHSGQEEDQYMKASCLVSWTFCCCCLCVFFRSVHGCMGMDVWVNDFRMPFLCADSGPWRKMSRAWPAMSAITTSSGSTCPSHQESAWWAAEASQEKVIVGVVRKDIVVGKCWRKCWTHLQMISVSTVLGEKASVLRSRCQASWPSPTSTLDRKRTTKRRRYVWWVVGFALCFRSEHGWTGTDVRVNVFRMS